MRWGRIFWIINDNSLEAIDNQSCSERILRLKRDCTGEKWTRSGAQNTVSIMAVQIKKLMARLIRAAGRLQNTVAPSTMETLALTQWLTLITKPDTDHVSFVADFISNVTYLSSCNGNRQKMVGERCAYFPSLTSYLKDANVGRTGH